MHDDLPQNHAPSMIAAWAFVALSISCTVYGQIIIKWRIGKAGDAPAGIGEKLSFFAHFAAQPWVVSSLFAGVVAAFSWMAALSQLELSRAYPFVASSFVVVLLLSIWLFSEPLTLPKAVGAVLVVLGLIIGSQG